MATPPNPGHITVSGLTGAVHSADLYDGLAEAAHGQRQEILNQLAAVERRHAEHWAAKLVELGEPVSRGAVARVRGCFRGWRGGSPSMR